MYFEGRSVLVAVILHSDTDNVVCICASVYVLTQVEREHVFSLNYASVDDALTPICQIHRASTLMPSDQEAMVSVATSISTCHQLLQIVIIMKTVWEGR
jgi:hypothetical protein